MHPFPFRHLSCCLAATLLAGCLDDGSAQAPNQAQPPVETPPVETPPVETPPVETPPVETPPVVLPVPGPRPSVCAPLVDTLSIPDHRLGELSGANHIALTSCYADTPGPEDHYRLSVTQRTGVELRTDSGYGQVSTVLAVREVCNDLTSELWCNRSANTDGARSLVRAVLEPGHYEVVVDQTDWDWPAHGGPYSLTLTPFDAAPNATCDGAKALTTDGLQAEAMLGAAHPTQHSCTSANRPNLFYRFDAPPGQVTEITASAIYGDRTPYMQILNRCEPGADDACERLGSGSDGIVRVANLDAQPRSLILAVGSPDNVPSGTFDLTLDHLPLASNATCDAALPLATGQLLGDQDAAYGSAREAAACVDDRALFYSLTVPPRHRMVAQVNGAPWGQLSVQDGCGEDACRSWGGEVVNAGDTPLPVVLAVAEDEPFDLSSTVIPVAANAACEEAAPLPVGTTQRGDAAMGGAEGDECHAYFGGRPLYYSVVVPAAGAVDIAMTPDDPQFAPGATIAKRDSCEQPACDFFDGFFGYYSEGPPRTRLTNDGYEPKTIIVSVVLGDGTATEPVGFSISATEVDPGADEMAAGE